ncbi:MAG: adenylosuccinate synthetase [Spirochaetota bacterium]
MSDNCLIFGMQYGDEGKGKAVNYFIDKYDSGVRFNGGPNAGHTVIQDNKVYKLHQIPSGIVKGKPVYMEPGMVLDLNILKEESELFDKKLININNKIHIIKKKHIEADSEGSNIGTTKRGIAYCYADKVLRKGLRIKDIDYELPYNIYDIHTFNDKNYLFESAQGIMLDIDYGDYPYCTSSSMLPSIGYNIRKVIGVMKSYMSRVGEGGPYKEPVEELQEIGNEVGTTTGRKRRCFWFDFDTIDYVMKIIKIDEIVMTKCDILEKASEIRAYKNNELIKYNNINEFIDDIKKHYPLKYLSWTPANDMETLYK